MRCLVTGTAGFIGFHLAKRLLEQGHEVTGVDGMTPYYDVKLKENRHALLKKHNGFSAHLCMLEDASKLQTIFERSNPELVFHLAAQAGVRYSLENPSAYIDSNVVGSFNILEMCHKLRPQHLLIASTSSVYGASVDFPLAETDRADHPLTVYAATKKSVEALAHSYAHLWDMPITVFRFFSAYGPWGRPDMALFKFVQNILGGRPIDVYNHGNMERDFTYVDDLVEAIVRLTARVPTRAGDVTEVETDSSSPNAPYRVVNIGGGNPVSLLRFIDEIEQTLGIKSERNYMGMQPGDVPRTEASTEFLKALIGYLPQTPTAVGVREFVLWYREYYRV
ncbi:NAD-dependent epimerase/dehydratase family protein [Reyranella sp.]|jgi:UDP-glucuronate 4-epimerase|uniref:NAD-dependent epimerase/dehydratase family protein n=1 Tax=Reyranella sp. TaxID=1929291 RepID=UPI000BD43AEA|nr:NAD-dependent epimerase/dehydratase family protein [Reyranella sp.]OYY43679.1 MAG: UDP-glucuronate 5-epimerase [Rhodospirillales bacterium 35-66-84]OYZ94507.1 MAG: UDP-glucuronate 5-epimerase [Rhodospirillales bacterium 24-66-33]OZB25597.1 MAG: UDP-glucuronate 5-epimerase [Rhodospirillales bacterium 39-66-50]HQS16763.1 NAD-dependent epimerase/dehydratase family protein [Reyranella sp.]HQT13489.1 NAD-dependent epimerase/dehydratase family protein [Reyranella sp.]